MLCALAACFLAMADAIPPELDAYLKRPEPSYAWSAKEPGLGALHLRMTSQTWRNVRWTHDIVVVDAGERDQGSEGPKKANDVAILYVTGGNPNQADLNEAERLSKLAKMPVALLFQIPNQPLWGMTEDDLIAHTFEQFLKTGESDWPLLLPMTKSAVKAMDALQESTAKAKLPFKKFVVIGASKRGWTTWLSGAVQDKRVIGIAPMVFDNLRLKEQLAHQLDLWGKYSEMLGDYTERGLDKIVDTPQGKKLIEIVDPWTYRERITMPKLIVNGSNDRYWSTDSLSLYWDGLKGPKYVTTVPNAGHLLGDMKQALEAIGAFARMCAGDIKIIEPKSYVRIEPGNPNAAIDKHKLLRVWLNIEATDPNLQWVRFWTTAGTSRDLRDARWTGGDIKVVPIRSASNIEDNRGSWSHVLDSPRTAVFAEFRYRINGQEFSLTSPVTIRM